MSNRNPSARYERLEQGLPFVIREWAKSNINTARPGIINSYDPATKRAKIQPALNMIFAGDTPSMAKPPILNVPVCQPSSGGHMVHHEIRDGDDVLLIFSDRGLEQYKAQWGEISDPPPESYFSERDALAIPWGKGNIMPVRTTGWLVQTEDGAVYLSLDSDTVRIVSGQTSITMVGDDLTIIAPSATVQGDVTMDGDVTVTGSLTVDGSDLTHDGKNVGKDHRHAGVQTGGGQTGEPV